MLLEHISGIFISLNIIKYQKNIDNGNSPVNPFDKKAKLRNIPAKKMFFNLLFLRLFRQKRTDNDTKTFIVFSSILLEQAQELRGIIIQKNMGIQLKYFSSLLVISPHIK